MEWRGFAGTLEEGNARPVYSIAADRRHAQAHEERAWREKRDILMPHCSLAVLLASALLPLPLPARLALRLTAAALPPPHFVDCSIRRSLPHDSCVAMGTAGGCALRFDGLACLICYCLPSVCVLAASSGGNQRETDRMRAQARAAKHAGTAKVGNAEQLKKKDSDAEAMRKKQEAADAKRAAAEAETAKAKAGGQIVKAKIAM